MYELKLTAVLNPKIFIFTALILLAGGIGTAYWYHTVVNQTESKSVVSILPKPVTTQPYSLQFDLSSPDDNALVYETNILVSGKTTPQTIVVVSLDDQDHFVMPDAAGNFSQTIKLKEGVNNLEVAAVDKLGNSDRAVRSVYYSREKL